MSRSRRSLLCLAFATQALAATSVVAHGDEEHGEPPPPPSASAEVRSATATTAAIELVVRWPTQAAAGGPLHLRVLASDWASNAPLEGAHIELSLSTPGHADVVASARATKSPGVYQGEVQLPADGHYAVAATIIAGELVDVVAIPDLEVGPPPVLAGAAPARGGAPWGVVASVMIIVASLGALLLLRRRRRARAAAPVATAVALLLSSAAQAHGNEEHGDAKPAPAAAPASPGSSGRVFVAKESQFLLGIRTALVETRPLADRVIVPGTVTAPPERHAAIFVPQSGRIAPPRGGFPQLGARVQQGQVLGVVEAVLSAPDRASFLAEEARARADAATAAARLDAAEKARARLASLAGVTSRQQGEAAEVEVASARAALAGAEARRAAFTTSAGASRFELVSPLAGVVADIGVSPGEILSAGDRAFLVVDPRELTVEAKVPEHELARLLGSSDALVSVDAFPGRSFAGAVRAQGQVIDPVTRTAKVVFTVANAEGLLKLGMFARVQIGAGADRSVTAVPDAAVLDIDGRRVVYLHVAPEEFEAREISVGRRDGELLEVLQGLDAGARVVVVGAYTLRNAPAR
ncbi:MAG: efflux RND transporter periplasmic adaptor subunit [Deltaproteobacteria bacterium]|nr:efflux RND transporter periplasmic adaptor subunit [Deltaproteobacteria bacterium]